MKEWNWRAHTAKHLECRRDFAPALRVKHKPRRVRPGKSSRPLPKSFRAAIVRERRLGGHVLAVGDFARQKIDPGARRHEEEQERRFAERRVTRSADRREDQGTG